MAVFRIERTRDYTVMSNHHLKDSALSLKAKGLLSMMLSLPEEWNYTTRGLAKICKEGVDAIGGALKELEKAGYIVRRQLRGQAGASATPSTPSTKSPAPMRKNRRRNRVQIRLHRIRLHQIRKTRIWWSRIWRDRIRICLQN